MSNKGFTTKKCLGCGQSNERKADYVCPECLEAIATHKANKEKYAKLKNENALDLVECNAPSSWEKPNYYTFRSNQHNKHLEPIGITLREIIDFISLSKGKQISWHYMRYLGNSATFEPYVNPHLQEKLFSRSKYQLEETILIPKRLRDLIDQLDKEINIAIQESEKAAIEYGKNALLMLNDGKITLDEFNKK